MKITGVRCRNLLSFGGVEVRLQDLTVVTGPNGAGKSNLGRAVDLVCAVIENFGGHPAGDRVGLYEHAARFGAPDFEVVLQVELDQPTERELVMAFFRSAVTLTLGGLHARPGEYWDAVVRDHVTERTLLPLLKGQLHVHYDAHMAQRWYAAWEFVNEGADWHIDLVGRSPALRPGSVGAHWRQPEEGIATPEDRWRQLPGVQAVLDRRKVAREPVALGELLPKTGGYSLTAQVPGDLRPIPASLVDLARCLGIAPSDARNSSFDFTRVLAQLLAPGRGDHRQPAPAPAEPLPP